VAITSSYTCTAQNFHYSHDSIAFWPWNDLWPPIALPIENVEFHVFLFRIQNWKFKKKLTWPRNFCEIWLQGHHEMSRFTKWNCNLSHCDRPKIDALWQIFCHTSYRIETFDRKLTPKCVRNSYFWQYQVLHIVVPSKVTQLEPLSFLRDRPLLIYFILFSRLWNKILTFHLVGRDGLIRWLDINWLIASIKCLLVIGYEIIAGMLFVENILWYMRKMKWNYLCITHVVRCGWNFSVRFEIEKRG
jgi:hypothetical protein